MNILYENKNIDHKNYSFCSPDTDVTWNTTLVSMLRSWLLISISLTSDKANHEKVCFWFQV